MTASREIKATLGIGFGLAFLLTVFLDVAILVVPIYDMQLYDRVLTSRNMDTLTMLSLACVAGLVLYALVEYFRSACFVAIGEAISRRLSGKVLEASVRRAAEGDRSVGPQLARDLNELQDFLSSGAVAVPLDAMCAPLFVAVLFLLHPAFSFLAIIGVSVLLIAGVAAEWLVRTTLVRAQNGRRAADQALSRSLSEPELAEGLGMLPAIGRRWGDRHGRALEQLNRAAAQAQLVAGCSRLARLVLQAGVVALGALLIIAGSTTPGSLMGANLLLNKMLGPFDQLVGTWRHWALAHAAWQRIQRLLATAETDATDCIPEGGRGLVVHGAEVRAPDGRTLLHDITLEIAPGTLAVIVGPNGAGKTTLLRLLAGVLRPSRGSVLLDGAPVRGGPAVGYLPQSVCLLDGSIVENVGRYEGELDDVVDASRRAGVHDLIGRMGRGYDTPLTSDGAALSGGMRQRVGLARALYGSPTLLLLDEPDASLDAEGSAALIRALRASCDAGAIAVVISHRPALREIADLEIELRAGRLVANEREARLADDQASITLVRA
ncbi:MAG: type I secretion system permease/ATPase [Acetobacteraceae bacterium]